MYPTTDIRTASGDDTRHVFTSHDVDSDRPTSRPTISVRDANSGGSAASPVRPTRPRVAGYGVGVVAAGDVIALLTPLAYCMDAPSLLHPARFTAFAFRRAASRTHAEPSSTGAEAPTAALRGDGRCPWSDALVVSPVAGPGANDGGIRRSKSKGHPGTPQVPVGGKPWSPIVPPSVVMPTALDDTVKAATCGWEALAMAPSANNVYAFAVAAHHDVDGLYSCLLNASVTEDAQRCIHVTLMNDVEVSRTWSLAGGICCVAANDVG